MADNYFKGLRSELRPFIPIGCKRVLEIGCGEGGFRSYFAQDIEYWGVEPSLAAYNVAAQNLSQVFNGTYDEVKNLLPECYFDLVVCNDVIEHMPNHDKFFNDIKFKMTQNSTMLISLPNVRYLTNIYELLVKKDWRYREAGILDTTHLRFFTLHSIKRTMTEHGYIIQLAQGINQPLGMIKAMIFFLTGILLGNDIKYPQFILLVKPKVE